MKKHLFLVLALLFLIFSMGFAREHIYPPYAWVFCLGGLVFFFGFMSLYSKRTFWQCLNISCTALMLALFVMEFKVAYPYFSPNKPILDQPPSSYSVPLPDNEEAAAAGNADIQISRSQQRMTVGDDTAYDITVSVFPDGRRITPYHPQAETAVVFFGCSFTFGTGLNDSETFAYKVGEKCGDSCMVYNLGRPGYGPHQMLDLVESGRLDEIAAKHDRVYAFFTTFTDHALRSAGYTSRLPEHPWYALEDGKIVRKGAFKDQGTALDRQVYRFFKRSQLYRRLLMPKANNLQPFMELYAALIKQTDLELRQRYGVNLTVVLWPGKENSLEILEDAGLELIDLDTFFPDYEQAPEKYKIPYDGHPNALADSIVAEAVSSDLALKEAGRTVKKTAL